MYTILPAPDSPECLEFYRNEFTSDENARRQYSIALDIARMMKKQEYITSTKCPRKGLLLVAMCSHDGMTFKNVLRKGYGSSDVIVYYYKGGRFNNSDDAKMDAMNMTRKGYTVTFQ